MRKENEAVLSILEDIDIKLTGVKAVSMALSVLDGAEDIPSIGTLCLAIQNIADQLEGIEKELSVAMEKLLKEDVQQGES